MRLKRRILASETEDVKKRLRKDEEDRTCQREGYRFGTGSEPMNCFNGYTVYSLNHAILQLTTDH
jgi:hypothetical protein